MPHTRRNFFYNFKPYLLNTRRRKVGRKPLFGVPPHGCRPKRPVRRIALRAIGPTEATLPIGMEMALSMARLGGEHMRRNAHKAGFRPVATRYMLVKVKPGEGAGYRGLGAPLPRPPLYV